MSPRFWPIPSPMLTNDSSTASWPARATANGGPALARPGAVRRNGRTEFDYDIVNAFRYRDYVIRAFNADLPINQFVTEQIAGDLLESPRRHPAEGFNESILGTGFYFLGEGTHSPVDVREEQMRRIDNQIDVISKTFLGLTVACARCHDHKFDPITNQDYYALAGFLRSSRHQQASIDRPSGSARDCKRLPSLKENDRRALRERGGPGDSEARRTRRATDRPSRRPLAGDRTKARRR